MKIYKFKEYMIESVKYSDTASLDSVYNIAKENNIDLSKYDSNEIDMGMYVELEHGTISIYNITNDNILMTLKIALAHLDENPKYYTELKKSGVE